MEENSRLNVSIVQCDIEWENSSSNLEHISSLVIGSSGDLVVLPEMFATGFSMSPERIAQQVDSSSIVEQISSLSVCTGKSIIFSAAILDKGNYYNRLYFITPTGERHFYNKRHLFTMANEDKHYSAGSDKLIVTFHGFRICMQICYDLRFPVFSRRTEVEDYDMLVYIASWPSVRRYAWDTLLRARAIENQCYCVGVNRVGSDPKNDYSGGSVVLDFLGGELNSVGDNSEGVAEAEISLKELREFRAGFNALADADKFTLECKN